MNLTIVLFTKPYLQPILKVLISIAGKLESGQFFVCCPVSDGSGDLESYEVPYHPRGRVVMNNHPLMIMDREENRVKKP